MQQTDKMRENNILIVDDDKSVRDFLVLFLKKKGHMHLLSAETAQEAFKLMESNQVQLVLLDIMLPDTNGLDVLRKIKEKNKDIGVILITGFPDEEKAKKALKEGAYDYIVKPFDLKYLELSVLSKIVLMSG